MRCWLQFSRYALTLHGDYVSTSCYIAALIKLLEGRPAGQGNTRPYALEEELVRVFTRLDIQAVSHTDPFTLEDRIRLKDCGVAEIENIPERFESFSEAHRFFCVFARRSSHCGAIARQVGQPLHGGRGMPNIDASTLEKMSPATHLKDLSQWGTAFDPIYRDNFTKNEPWLLMQRLQYITIRLNISHFAVTEETNHDQSIAEFQEMVYLSKILLVGKKCGFDFSIDLQTIYPLNFVGKKCRHPSIRREAIQLLECTYRREGIWDNVVTAKICSWIMEVEKAW